MSAYEHVLPSPPRLSDREDAASGTLLVSAPIPSRQSGYYAFAANVTRHESCFVSNTRTKTSDVPVSKTIPEHASYFTRYCCCGHPTVQTQLTDFFRYHHRYHRLIATCIHKSASIRGLRASPPRKAVSGGRCQPPFGEGSGAARRGGTRARRSPGAGAPGLGAATPRSGSCDGA